MVTYRYRGHSMSDPAKYRSREEVQKVREERDPTGRRRALRLGGGTAEDRLRALDAEIRAQVAEAVKAAEAMPQPGAAELHADVRGGEGGDG